MKTIRTIVAVVVAAGMLAVAAPADAKVRDPISRKFQPEKGFFEGRPTASTSRSTTSTSRFTTSTKSQGRAPQQPLLKARSWNPLFR